MGLRRRCCLAVMLVDLEMMWLWLVVPVVSSVWLVCVTRLLRAGELLDVVMLKSVDRRFMGRLGYLLWVRDLWTLVVSVPVLPTVVLGSSSRNLLFLRWVYRLFGGAVVVSSVVIWISIVLFIVRLRWLPTDPKRLRLITIVESA